MTKADDFKKSDDPKTSTKKLDASKIKQCIVSPVNEELSKRHELLSIITQKGEKTGGGGGRSGSERGGNGEEIPESLKLLVPSLAYGCPYCETSYSKRGNLKRHLMIGCGRDPNNSKMFR
ncbi:hypothetical protein M0802_011726 [Mischocyttarus mexicanus]|nr:hypothetical protein M0802_011726 [Mischocyttarus mexicanus]